LKPLSSQQAGTFRHRTKLGSLPIHWRGGFKVIITGPGGLERSVSFVIDESPAIIIAHIRAALDE